MNASAGRGDEGITREFLIGRVAMMNIGEAEMEAGMGSRKHVQMRLVGLGDRQVLVVEPGQAVGKPAKSEATDEVWGTFRSMIDRLDAPLTEARSEAMFARLMRKVRDQQDTELRWRWARRVMTAVAAAAGAGAVRLLTR